jgi:2-methylaconitate isomerase
LTDSTKHPPAPQLRIRATYARGGTSKGLFFRLQDLPDACQVPGPARDRLLLRLLGSPDPYGKQIDGMGNASSSTSKAVILAPASRADHDVDYLFGQVSIDQPLVDWSGNCGNLSSAVGPLALSMGLVHPSRVPDDGVCMVRIWQANIGKTILAHVPMAGGQVVESGDFELDGVTFPAAEVRLEFLQDTPAGEGHAAPEDALFPTGRLVDTLEVPGIGALQATLINAGIPTVFVRAEALGLDGTELPSGFNTQRDLLGRLEGIRIQGALAMGLIRDASEAVTRQHTPKLAWVARPQRHPTSSGRIIEAHEVDVLVRALSMGQLHHAMMGTAAVAIAAAASVPGTLVHEAAGSPCGNAGIRFAHPSGTLRVGAQAVQQGGAWRITRAIMSRSARILMEGWVRVPADTLF